jgi:hypothetical protein
LPATPTLTASTRWRPLFVSRPGRRFTPWNGLRNPCPASPGDAQRLPLGGSGVAHRAGGLRPGHRTSRRRGACRARGPVAGGGSGGPAVDVAVLSTPPRSRATDRSGTPERERRHRRIRGWHARRHPGKGATGSCPEDRRFQWERLSHRGSPGSTGCRRGRRYPPASCCTPALRAQLLARGGPFAVFHLHCHNGRPILTPLTIVHLTGYRSCRGSLSKGVSRVFCHRGVAYEAGPGEPGRCAWKPWRTEPCRPRSRC